MSLKEKFLSYVELQRAANAAREAYGYQDKRTTKAYHAANTMKRQIVTELEEFEHERINKRNHDVYE